MLAWLSPIWTIGAFDSCVHMSEEAANAARAVPYGIMMSIGSCWVLGFIIMIVIAACINPDLESVLGSGFGQPMAQIYYDACGKHATLGSSFSFSFFLPSFPFLSSPFSFPFPFPFPKQNRKAD
jgi:amino acid transporter